MYKAIVFDFDGTIVDTEQHLFNIINKHLISHNATPITLDFTVKILVEKQKDLHEYLEQTIEKIIKKLFIKNTIKQVIN